MTAKRWTFRKHDADAVNKLAAELQVKPLIAARNLVIRLLEYER